jgi:hypothetical protein
VRPYDAPVPATATAPDAAAPAPDDRRATRLIVGASIAVLAVPVVVDLLASGRKRVHAYLAADAFYYLQVARNVVDEGSVSFDGRHATNGFHPLWQGVLSVEQGVASLLGAGRTPMLYVSVLTGLLVLVGMLLLLAAAMRTAYGRLTPLFVIVPVGVYALAFAPVWIWSGGLRDSGINPFEGPMPLYGTLWSYANGMETPLVLAAFALTTYLVVRRWGTGVRVGAVLGASLALMVLARLDTALIAAGILGVFALAAFVRRDRALATTVGGAVAVLGGVLLVYVVVNKVYAGAWLPVSGTLKSTFPEASLGNWRDLRSLFEDPEFLGPVRWYRQFPMVVPALVAIVFVATARMPTLLRSSLEDARDRYRLLLVGTAVGVVALSAYDFFFVPAFNQGHWYYPVATLFVTLAALDWCARVDLSRRVVVVAAACVLVSALVFVTLGRRDDYHRRFADLWFDGAPALLAAYPDGVPPVLEFDDGIDVVALETQGLSGIGLMLDDEAIEAYEDDRLLDLALERGVDRIASLAYFDATGLTKDTPSDELRERIAMLLTRPGEPPPDLSGFEFEVEHRLAPGALSTPWAGSDGSYVVIRVRRA